MTKTVVGKYGVRIEFTLPDDLPDGDKLHLIRKIQEIADILQDAGQLEEVVDKLGITFERSN